MPDNVSESKKHFITDEMALNVASQLDLDNVKSEENKYKFRSKFREIENLKLISSEDKLPMFYAINYKNNQGFALISSDKRITPILAYSEKGNFDAETEENGVSIWLSIVSEAFKSAKKLEKPNKEIEASWIKYDRKGSKNGKISNCDGSYIPSDISVGPFTRVLSEWGQKWGYNFQAPSRGNASCACDNAAAGCGPVAIAQVMRFHRRPFIYQGRNYSQAVFDAMPQRIVYNINNNIMCDGFNQNELNIAQLIRDCGVMTGTNYNWPTVSCQSWTEPDHIPNAFADAGYSQTGNKVFFYGNISQVESELISGNPVIIKGSTCDLCFAKQHIWVCDGLRRTYGQEFVSGYDEYGYYYEYCITHSNTTYSMNWGLESANDGWYTLYGFIGPGGDTYNSSGMRVFINIRP